MSARSGLERCSQWLRTAALVVGLSGCDQRLEVLTGAADGGAISAPLCDSCGADDPACQPDRCVPLPALSRLAAGAQHTCRVLDGELYCWGANGSGQLGTGDAQSRSVPTRVSTSADWSSVAAGSNHTCGIRQPGRLFCWGDNSQGQLGRGSGDAGGSRGRQRQTTDWEDFSEVACGFDNCCALRASGALYCWGANLDGSAGVGLDSTSISRPTRVDADHQYLRVMSVGGGHSCAIRGDGMLMCWGRNNFGQLGIGADYRSKRSPVPVGQGWLRVTAGADHTCAIRGDGALACWGDNTFVQLGLGRETLDAAPLVADTPWVVNVAPDWVEVDAGSSHTCALKESGELRCWGRGSAGQLGAGARPSVAYPTKVAPAMGWEAVALGEAHSCGLDLDGNLHCWGDNADGQLGVGDFQSRDHPALLSAP